MNHFPSREQVQALRERYPPGTMIQLTADMQGERFRAGDIGKVTSVDDAGQIHLAWLKGGSLAIIPGVDSFREIEPLALNPYLDKGNLRINGYYVDACTDNGIERADAWGKTEIRRIAKWPNYVEKGRRNPFLRKGSPLNKGNTNKRWQQ